MIKTDKYGIKKWDQTFSKNYTGEAGSVLETSDGGYLVVGTCRHKSGGDYDIWLIKTDDNGKKEWDKHIGGGNSDGGYSAAQTTDGGYILTGYTIPEGEDERRILLIKTDISGNIQWNRTYDENYWGRSVKQILDGGYVLVSSNLKMIKTDSLGFCHSTGFLYSVNLLKERIVYSINNFTCHTIIPTETTLEIQFSQDNESWGNSKGQLLSANRLYDGTNHIDLSKLEWTESKFFYKVKFNSDGEELPAFKKIKLTYKLKTDTDGDDIPDELDEDDDNDGYLDEWEQFLNTDQHDSKDKPTDTDNDGIPDGDQDNSQFWMDKDDDNDSYRDAWELYFGINPKDPNKTPRDFDGDFKPDGDINNSQPWMDKDDDNDAYPDNLELEEGSNPKDPNDKPKLTTKPEGKPIDPIYQFYLIIFITIFLILLLIGMIRYMKKKVREI
jgi:hypothetical protein